MWWNKEIRSEGGYTLVESLIAMSILLAVLVPSAMFLTTIGNNTLSKDKIIAHNLARNTMEQVLASKNDSSKVILLEDNWWIKQEVTRNLDLYEIKIEVFKRDTVSTPKVTLQTARLWY